MRQKPCKISFRLNEHQKEVLDEEAQRQGITVSKLMMRMSGSYLEAQRKGEPLTAVTYGEWLLVYHDLAGVDEALRSLVRQLVATRSMVSMLTEKGALSERRATDMVLAMRMCRQDVVEAHAQISSCLERLEGMHEAWVAVDVSGLPVASPLAQG